MEHPGFFTRAGPFTLGDIAQAADAALAEGAHAGAEISDVRPLAEAGAGHLSFFDNPKYRDQFRQTRATACFVGKKFAADAPEGVSLLVSDDPYRSFALALSLFYPEARRSVTAGAEGWEAGSGVHPSATLEEGVVVEQGAVVGPEANIGSGTRIAAGAVVGYRVHIGRDCCIGPNVSVTHALIGNRVILHAGVSVGQDGFGFAMGPKGHLKVVQIGRVVIQDDVEIGANTTIDRGALSDTVIGEGTKIDNLVQIAHNVVIGRHCVIVAQTGISGSTELGDFVVLGGQVGLAGHLKIGSGAQIAAGSGVHCDIPPGTRWGGYPVRPAKSWWREVATLKVLAGQPPSGRKRARDRGPDEPPAGAGC